MVTFFEESYIPLINNLSEEFNIYFLISDEYLNKRHIFKIKDLKKNGLIKEFFILTGEKISLKFHLFLKNYANTFLNKMLLLLPLWKISH